MKNVKINGEEWFLSSQEQQGDLFVIEGIQTENAKLFQIYGQILGSSIYKILLDAFATVKFQDKNFKLYLNIPNFVRKDVRNWAAQYGLMDDIVFADTKETGVNTADSDIFAEKIVINPNFGKCFFIVSQSKLLPGTVPALMQYLNGQFGEQDNEKF